MKVISTTHARKHLAALVNGVHHSHRPVAIGRRRRAEALLIDFPEFANDELDEVTNMNQYGGGFDFLAQEPELYTRTDLKKRYV